MLKNINFFKNQASIYRRSLSFFLKKELFDLKFKNRFELKEKLNNTHFVKKRDIKIH